MTIPKITPPWWAEMLVAIAFIAFAVWLIYSEPTTNPPAWMVHGI